MPHIFGHSGNMQQQSCFFGIFFQRERKMRGISLWKMALRMSYHIRNLQRIEKGESQPGITLAFRMLDSIGAEPGEFLWKLSLEPECKLPPSVSPLMDVKVNFEIPVLKEGQKTLFGPLLLQARMTALVSQTAMAKAACYTLSNLNAVEKGRQEPGIMTALALVMTTGADVRHFFDTLHRYWKEVKGE